MRAYLSGTPGRLRAAAVVCAATVLVFGGVGFLSFQLRSEAQSTAHDQTEQVVRVQRALTQAVQADSGSTDAYLRGGLEPSAQRAEYDATVSALSRSLVEVCEGTGPSGERLDSVNESLVLYADATASARANNRQGFPVGSAYLRQASDHLRKGIVPELETLTHSGTGRVDDSFDRARWSGHLLLLFGLTAAGVLLHVQWRLARRTRRVLNLPLLAATVGVLVALGGGLGMTAVAQQRMDDVREGPYAATVALSRARIAGFDARALESLILIARGGADGYESRLDQRLDQVDQALDEADRAVDLPDTDLTAAWRGVHERIRALDRAGDWDAAVELATTGSDTGAAAAFDRFDESTQTELSRQSALMSSGFDDAGSGLDLVGAAVLLLGVLAAAAAWWGISLRWEEYR